MGAVDQRAWVNIRENQPLVLEFGGELDVASLAAIEDQIGALLHRDKCPVVVDMAAVTFMDSSAVAVLIRLANHFGALTIEHASPTIRRIIEVLGLVDRLRIGPE